MDWKRIMNRKKKQKKSMEGEQSAQTKETVMTEEEVRQYLEGQLAEWNLRLLTDPDTLADMVLWVESVAVTAYRFPPERQLSEKRKVRNLFWIFKHLMGRFLHP